MSIFVMIYAIFINPRGVKNIELVAHKF